MIIGPPENNRSSRNGPNDFITINLAPCCSTVETSNSAVTHELLSPVQLSNSHCIAYEVQHLFTMQGARLAAWQTAGQTEDCYSPAPLNKHWAAIIDSVD